MTINESPEHLEGGHWAVINGVRKWVDNQPPTVDRDELLKAAAKSPNKRTRTLGVKIAAMLADLGHRLKEDEADQERLDRIAALEAEIRKLKGKKPGRPAPAVDDTPCNDCGRTFSTVQALRLHERRTHQGFDPHAVHAARESA